MTTRRLFVGMTVMFALSVWSWCRGDGRDAEAHPSNAAAVSANASEGGNHDEAACRFRNSQAVHWRHVMIGGH